MAGRVEKKEKGKSRAGVDKRSVNGSIPGAKG